MVKFGKQLLQETLPEWREFYMNYRRLKRCIKRLQMEKEAEALEVKSITLDVRFSSARCEEPRLLTPLLNAGAEGGYRDQAALARQHRRYP